ncbi:hypothetical protein ANCDUO_10293, partial [Ancylostoma duodenale]
TKTNEFLVVLKSISLKGFFRLWGTFIGQFPLAFLISGLILCSLSCGIVKLHLRDNVRDGYTPRTSRSRLETDLYREFLGSEGERIIFARFTHEICIIHNSGDPAMTTVLMLAKDNGSMHRLNYLQVQKLYKPWCIFRKISPLPYPMAVRSVTVTSAVTTVIPTSSLGIFL